MKIKDLGYDDEFIARQKAALLEDMRKLKAKLKAEKEKKAAPNEEPTEVHEHK